MTWRDFVVRYGRGALGHELAAVLGQSVATIEKCRHGAHPLARGPRRAFAELFSLWHGRPPRDEDWPPPRRTPSGTYPWQGPEQALIARLAGQMGQEQIARVLTVRLRRVTGDPRAVRRATTVGNVAARLGIRLDQVLGGLTTAQAATRAGETKSLIQQEISKGRLRCFRVGWRLVIPERAFQEWSDARLPARPPGWVKLYDIKERMGLKTDVVSWHARGGRIPHARFCAGHRWYVPARVARDLMRRHRLGLPMPWSGYLHPSTVQRSYRLWRRRRHRGCSECMAIWASVGGPPRTFAHFFPRYLRLSEAVKRHLSAPDGLTATQAAALTGIDRHDITLAIKRKRLRGRRVRGWFVVRKAALLRWVKTLSVASNVTRGRMTFKDAARFLGSLQRVRREIRAGRLRVVRRWNGTPGLMRHEVSALMRQVRSVSVQEAARRCGISVPTFTRLAVRTQGNQVWRPGARVHPETVRDVQRRLQARWQVSFAEAARLLGKPRWWVQRAIDTGHLSPLRGTGDARRIVLGRKAVLALRRRPPRLAPVRKRRGRPVRWLTAFEATDLAGVGASTLKRWGDLGWLRRARGIGRIPRGGNGTGWFYSEASVKRAARRYWRTRRFKRATPPAWVAA